jgi:hypothetical protein
MEDGNFWHLGSVTRWNSQFLKYTWTFLAIICVASHLFLCFFWISLKNRCLQHPCFKNLCKIAQASKNSDSNAQHFLSDLLSHSWFHSMLFALPDYQFPYNVMNRCLSSLWCFVVQSPPNHTPKKYRSPSKKSNWIAPASLILLAAQDNVILPLASLDNWRVHP